MQDDISMEEEWKCGNWERCYLHGRCEDHCEEAKAFKHICEVHAKMEEMERNSTQLF